MRKLVLAAVVFFLFSGMASAVPIDCTAVERLTQLLTMGPDGCQHQDKIFRDYSYSNLDAALVNATHRFGPGGQVHGWTFARLGGWETAFTLSYIIEVAPGNPLAGIFAARDQQEAGLIPNPTAVTDTQMVLDPLGQVLILNTTGGVGGESAQGFFNPLARSIRTTTVFSPNGGQLFTWEQLWGQTVIPEPSTWLGAGAGVALLLFVASRRSSRLRRS